MMHLRSIGFVNRPATRYIFKIPFQRLL